MSTKTNFFVVAAPGHYGDTTRVMSAHRTVDAARKMAGGGGWVVRVGSLRKGDTFRRASESFYPMI